MTISTKELTKKDLGQYFTPAVVVDFALEMARAIGGPSLGKGARVIDPACGGGAFLIAALEKGIGSSRTIFGVDIDSKVREEWQRNELALELGRNLYIANGLYDPADNRVSEKLPLRQFDLVVGNPPYGGLGVRGVEKDQKLLNFLKTYELWRLGQRGNNDEDQGYLFGDDMLERLRRLEPEEVNRLERFPVEVLFVERFVRLAKEGGVIAIVIPDGILANVKFDYVRNWLAERCHVVAVVSLPRGTFREAGTTAKTSLLFLRKRGERTRGPKHVFMAQLEEGKNGGPPDGEDFDFVLDKFRERFKGYAANSPVIWTSTTTDDIWNNRWDADFWDPGFTEPIRLLEKRFGAGISLEDTDPFMTYGAIITRRKPKPKNEGVLYINIESFLTFGFDVRLGNFISKGSDWNIERAGVKRGDVLIVRAGEGSLGKAEVYYLDIPATVGCFVDILRQDEINPYYLALFLKSKFGQIQFRRLKSGVTGLTNVNFNEIKSILVPLLKPSDATKIENAYKRILKSHYEVVRAKFDLAKKYLKEGIDKSEADKAAAENPAIMKELGALNEEFRVLIGTFESFLEGTRDDLK